MAKKIDQKGIPPLHFFGERKRPDRPEEVLDRRFVLGERKIPAELQRLQSRMSVHVYTDGGEEKPKVQVERVKTAWRGSSWRVDLSIMEKEQIQRFPSRRTAHDGLTQHLRPSSCHEKDSGG